MGADLATAAEELRARHQVGHPLILPNVWDPPSAVAVERAGFPVVATSSAAMLAAIGLRDGGIGPRDEAFAAIARITAAVTVPVSADIEDGYGLAPADLAGRLLSAGVVGCNLEDSDHGAGDRRLIDPGVQATRIAELRAAAREHGVGLVINARIDTYVGVTGDPADQLDETIHRASVYLGAGADCVYPIMAPEAAIATLVERIPGAVNVLAPADADAIARLAALGVARISMGGKLARAAGQFLAGLLEELGLAAG